MGKAFFFLLILAAGFWFGSQPAQLKKVEIFRSIDPAKEFAVSDHKSFVIVIYAHNQATWCKRALRSIFEQDYDHYRVVMIDDASIDRTETEAKEFILENNQENKVIYIRNESFQGKVASFYRGIENCLPQEIIIELDAKDWLVSPLVLNQLNCAYQNPDVWIVKAAHLDYPTYQVQEGGFICYYSQLFQQIALKNLLINSQFIENPKDYHSILLDLSGGRMREMKVPIVFENLAAHQLHLPSSDVHPKYESLSSFPLPQKPKGVDVLLFSEGDPKRLYLALESFQRQVTGFESLKVLIKSNGDFLEEIKRAFPLVEFIEYSPSKLKEIILESSEYILVGSDQQEVEDVVHLERCAEELKRTGAFAFYLLWGNQIPIKKQNLFSGAVAWDLKEANPNGFALYQKEVLKKLKYKSSKDLLSSLEKSAPEGSIGLSF